MNNILNSKILYVDEHLSCNQYMHNVTQGFILKDFEKGSTKEIRSLAKHTIIFILEGVCILDYKNFKNVSVVKNNIIFLPKGSNVTYKIEQETKAIFLLFETLLSGCDQNLIYYCSKYINNVNYNFSPLKMHESLEQFSNTLNFCLERGIQCNHFHELKHKEFFMYLRYFYKKEEIANFLYPIIGVKPDFKQFILDNWKIGMSVEEIIEQLPMSKSTFIRNFEVHFKTTPYAWYQNKISDKIVQQAIFPDTTVKKLMEIAQITDNSQFNRFCKRNFNCTPKKLLEHYRKIKY